MANPISSADVAPPKEWLRGSSADRAATRLVCRFHRFPKSVARRRRLPGGL